MPPARAVTVDTVVAGGARGEYAVRVALSTIGGCTCMRARARGAGLVPKGAPRGTPGHGMTHEAEGRSVSACPASRLLRYIRSERAAHSSRFRRLLKSTAARRSAYIGTYSCTAVKCNRFVYRALRSAVSEGPTQARPHPTLRHTGSISNGTAICAISSLVFVLTIIVSYHKRAQGRSAATPGAGWGPITAQDIQHDTGGTSVHRSSEPGATEILDAGGPDVFVV